MMGMFVHVYKDQGVTGLYRGVGACGRIRQWLDLLLTRFSVVDLGFPLAPSHILNDQVRSLREAQADCVRGRQETFVLDACRDIVNLWICG